MTLPSGFLGVVGMKVWFESVHEKIRTEEEGTPVLPGTRQELREAFTNVLFGNLQFG